ncbi:hypothetical protein ERO13_D09G008000v2 [Gossypium hirsutum]|uniref:Mitochondrial import inner membrane translocase subunit TIM50 n=2 Tax=Gossypium TaxID=3633 RepID=A0A1U8MU98_GOSHI|nr:ubiquitin-like domain-containing CTD phosphatase 1 isoform X1 [Gossypium hirsutum]KAG4128223.1 hypothetical protein ERO13_D09G008000v2 [Gossypium hirsutum]TYH52180.1 hypothetical protein ES332_D09G009900v1 [Gossypium tomentosum]
MEADLVKENDRKRSLHENHGFSTNSDSFSIANIEMQGSFVELNESQASFVGTFETGKDAAQIFSETRSAIRKKTKFRKRMEQLDSSDCSDQSQIDKHPEEVGLTNTDQTNTVSGPTLSDEGNSEEKIDSFDANETSDVSLAIVIPPVSQSRKKLLVLDLNGLLADIVYNPSIDCTPDALVAGRAVFKRPYCDDFLKFCCERFEVGIWSSRNRKNVERFIDFLMGDMKQKLLFCWDSSYCTTTQFNTLGHKYKPLVFKDLRKLWEKHDPDLAWEKGYYNESNTLLIDDSPYKALLNPPHTAIFPHSFKFDMKDNSLGDGGDLKVYLERLASADNVQNFVEQNPLGQIAITERSQDWGFYSQVIDTCLQSELQNDVGLPT